MAIPLDTLMSSAAEDESDWIDCAIPVDCCESSLAVCAISPAEAAISSVPAVISADIADVS